MKLVLVDPSIGRLVFDFLLPHFLQFFKEVVTEFHSLHKELSFSNAQFSFTEAIVLLMYILHLRELMYVVI